MIFISYRKEDSQPIVDLLAEKLKQHFGEAAVFKDDRDIRVGEDWPEKLRDELEARKVLIAVHEAGIKFAVTSGRPTRHENGRRAGQFIGTDCSV